MLLFGLMFTTPSDSRADEFLDACAKYQAADPKGRVVCADITALEQPLVYNRFGSLDAFGMIFALNRDVRKIDELTGDPEMPACEDEIGTAMPSAEPLEPGNVRLRDCKRPRPLVLRANVGDTLVVHVTNLLAPSRADGHARDFSRDFCPEPRTGTYERDMAYGGFEQAADGRLVEHGEADCGPASATTSVPDWPETRGVNLVVQGLMPQAVHGESGDACRGTTSVPPGQSFTCVYRIDREGTYFFASPAAPAGGQGDGGSIVHGLFGAILAERAGSRVYRSQTSRAAFDRVWSLVDQGEKKVPLIGYETLDDNGVPILDMHRRVDLAAGQTPQQGQDAFAQGKLLEVVHSDVNAIVYCDTAAPGTDCRPPVRPDTTPTTEPGFDAFREFSVFFHDELKTSYTQNFRDLDRLGQLAGVKDGFAINYGASGMGSLLLSNRKGIGPAANCMECLYEEFFLSSWANGDPALLENYDDDPSNVHHSYLNDPVVFRNFHAGPKETHVFHLHAHQWFGGNDPGRGSYLDSQTVGPQQGFTYNIYHGGLAPDGSDGRWGSQGSGNRNRTVGDSIFHCHLYPHFAQGMWELWRVHDVLEDGTRLLPDGQEKEGLSLSPQDRSAAPRLGSVNSETGEFYANAKGTPIPALIPLPGEPIPLRPSYAPSTDVADGVLKPDAPTPMPGYPFYIAGQPGHRPPQAPLDIASNLGAPLGEQPAGDSNTDRVDDRAKPGAGGFADGRMWLDGGLNRHVVETGSKRKLGAAVTLTKKTDPTQLSQAVAKAFALGDLSGHLTEAKIKLLNPYGTRLERAAMGFHSDGRLFMPGDEKQLRLTRADGTELLEGTPQSEPGAYPTTLANLPAGGKAPEPPLAPLFHVNGSAPKPGAPFADPCGRPPATAATSDPLVKAIPAYATIAFRPDEKLTGFRRYEASAVQVDLVVNGAGWHDPQGRINVLTVESDRYKNGQGRISPRISDSEEPFFFRALSGECIEFRHTNELPKELELDDFQVKTPTDTIGQHIHLVKFDVTSSDGSGNGWNYEDGTFAPDEVLARRCAATVAGGTVSYDRDIPEQQHGEVFRTPDPADCARLHDPASAVWRLKRSEHPEMFQTTTQRWFADPILTKDEHGNLVDRTMRTVFTHDHFGPSSIQQHGFYAGLLVEPPFRPATSGEKGTGTRVCGVETAKALVDGAEKRIAPCISPLPEAASTLTQVAWGGKTWEGARRRILVETSDKTAFEHESYREFALSIADFATLYDPRDRNSTLWDEGEPKGMARLACEARYRLEPANLKEICGNRAKKEKDGSGWYFPDDVPPAWLAAGANREPHQDRYIPGLLTSAEATKLAGYATDYRRRAMGGAPVTWMAQPVAPSDRPEAITADHHDPYLVNYRGAPIPLRIGDKVAGTETSADCTLLAMSRAGETLWPGANGEIPDAPESAVVKKLKHSALGPCSITRQLTGVRGDVGAALSSRLHGDPDTPLLEAFQDERLMFRLIQGAQEVQHVFSIAGQPFRRNPDQAFPAGMQRLGETPAWLNDPPVEERCRQQLLDGKLTDVTRGTQPSLYRTWSDMPRRERKDHEDKGDSPWADEGPYWTAYEKALAECVNIEGMTTAQEIGISEHFEMRGSLRADVTSSMANYMRPISSLLMSYPAGNTAVPDESADFRYDFGTLDAVWNGAWGLLRIYRDLDTKDPVTVAAFNGGRARAASPPLGERLAEPSGGMGAGIRAGKSEPVTGLQCPLDAFRDSGIAAPRRVSAVIVAVKAREVFDPAGTRYGAGVHDPDGLVLALLSPTQAGLEMDEGMRRETLDDAGQQRLLKAVQAAYGGTQPEPFVLRVRAGDCVQLRYVNLLGHPDGQADDHLGDAVLPPIVPLNVDPIPQAKEGYPTTTGKLAWPPDHADQGPLGTVGGLRASSRLALTVALPGLDLIRETPLGYGYNEQALRHGEVSALLKFYAGRYRIKPGNLDQDISNRASAIVKRKDAELSVEIVGNPTEAERNALPNALGRTYTIKWKGTALRQQHELESYVRSRCGASCVNVTQQVDALLTETQGAIQKGLSANVHWIPYAFGTLPLRPSADLIGQITHGLFGAIDVVPSNWNASDADLGLTCAAKDPDGFTPCEAAWVPGRGDGDPVTWKVAVNDGKTPGEETVREFVLFYQDGLNLHDESSRIKWTWPDGSPVAGANGMIPDCGICDDSYDRGEKAVSYHSPALSRLLRSALSTQIEESDDLNADVFPPDWPLRDPDALRLAGCAGTMHPQPKQPRTQILIRAVHPGGRARQHAFVMNGFSYDDLFPGFGFPHSALLAPGKSVSAWLRPDAAQGRTLLWHDGPTQLRAGGIWGLLDLDECAAN